MPIKRERPGREEVHARQLVGDPATTLK